MLLRRSVLLENVLQLPEPLVMNYRVILFNVTQPLESVNTLQMMLYLVLMIITVQMMNVLQDHVFQLQKYAVPLLFVNPLSVIPKREIV